MAEGETIRRNPKKSRLKKIRIASNERKRKKSRIEVRDHNKQNFLQDIEDEARECWRVNKECGLRIHGTDEDIVAFFKEFALANYESKDGHSKQPDL